MSEVEINSVSLTDKTVMQKSYPKKPNSKNCHKIMIHSRSSLHLTNVLFNLTFLKETKKLTVLSLNRYKNDHHTFQVGN